MNSNEYITIQNNFSLSNYSKNTLSQKKEEKKKFNSVSKFPTIHLGFQEIIDVQIKYLKKQILLLENKQLAESISSVVNIKKNEKKVQR